MLARPNRLERFRREARSAAGLHHTNIVPVFGIGQADGRHYYAMQFIAGHPLDAVIDEVRRQRDDLSGELPSAPEAVTTVATALITGTYTRPAGPAGVSATHASGGLVSGPSSPSPAESLPRPSLSGSLSDDGRDYWVAVARVGAQVAHGLAHAHAQGVLHRDIKPANLLLDLKGTVWVTDFGLAKAKEPADLTLDGEIVGTLRYMAPERFVGAGDHRADIYALGLTLYELLTLRPAFDAAEGARLIEQARVANPPTPHSINPAVPLDLETVVLKAICYDPAERYQDAGELADDLRRFVEDRPVLARHRRRPSKCGAGAGETRWWPAWSPQWCWSRCWRGDRLGSCPAGRGQRPASRRECQRQRNRRERGTAQALRGLSLRREGQPDEPSTWPAVSDAGTSASGGEAGPGTRGAPGTLR